MKTTLFVALVFLSHITTYGITEVKDGYYIKHSGDTVYGRLKIRVDFKGDIHFTRLQSKLYFLDSLDNLHIFKPDELHSYSFENDGENFKFVSIYFYKKRKLFLQAINEDGYLKLYTHYRDVIDSRTDYGNLSYYLLSYPKICKKDYFIITKPDGEFLKVGTMYISKKMSLFLADYHELAYRIRKNIYGFGDIERIIWSYNIWSKKKLRECVSINGIKQVK